MHTLTKKESKELELNSKLSLKYLNSIDEYFKANEIYKKFDDIVKTVPYNEIDRATTIDMFIAENIFNWCKKSKKLKINQNLLYVIQNISATFLGMYETQLNKERSELKIAEG